MKKLSSILVIVLSILALPSCNFLNLTDPDSFDESKFYRDSADMEGLVFAAYNALRPAYDKLFFVTEMKSDNATTTDMGTAGGLYYTFVSHNVSSSNTIVATIYDAFYFCIHRCNLVLEHIDGIPMSDTERQRLRGEAMYLRALSHFYLVRLWGPVTIMRHTITSGSEATSVHRDPVEDVYNFIIEDLKTVADGEMLPAVCPDEEFGRATRTAACALLGRVYLQYAATQNKPDLYNDAITYLERALSVSGYSGLGQPYNKLFSLEGQTDNEVIFPIMYAGTASQCSNFAQYFEPQGAKGLTCGLVGRGFNTGQENLYNEFEEKNNNGFPVTDRRVATAIRKYTDGTYYTRKYTAGDETIYCGNLWFEIRFADVYLMLAEAYERIGNDAKAIENLDIVRARPNSTVKSYSESMTNAAYAAAYPTLRDAIFHERRVELCFENQRWFDLMRLYPNPDDFVAYMHSVNEPGAGSKYIYFQKRELLLPIPFDEVFLNPGLGQNEGY